MTYRPNRRQLRQRTLVSAARMLISGHRAMEAFAHREGNFRMECLPTCTGPDHPPRSEPISYPEYQSWYRNDDAPAMAA